MTEGLLLDAAADLVDGLPTELDDVEGVDHGDLDYSRRCVLGAEIWVS